MPYVQAALVQPVGKLPWVNTYRTLLVVPSDDIRATLRGVAEFITTA